MCAYFQNAETRGAIGECQPVRFRISECPISFSLSLAEIQLVADKLKHIGHSEILNSLDTFSLPDYTDAPMSENTTKLVRGLGRSMPR